MVETSLPVAVFSSVYLVMMLSFYFIKSEEARKMLWYALAVTTAIFFLIFFSIAIEALQVIVAKLPSP